MRSTEAVVERLVRDLPVLRGVLDQHLQDQGGELLEYLFIADVERWAEATVRSDPTVVETLLSWLDREYEQGDAAIQEWIAFGFVEVLPGPAEPAAALRLKLGPALRRVADELG